MATDYLYHDFNWKGTIRKIYHISDIHIHLNSRHQEYQHVFEKLYNIIKGDTEGAITLITGDILHSKTELLPECIEFTRKFFMDLSKIIPLVFIAGNHDMNVSNEHRMDALTPIRNGIGADYPIYYLEKTGVYRFGHILFSLASVRDYIIIDPTIIKREDGDVLISLFHGRVNGAQLNNGIKVDGELNRRTNKTITPASFAGYDYVMMGDIHMQQFFGDSRHMAYAGSLVQQNHGESLQGHGVLVWNIDDEQEFIDIPSDYGFITIVIKNGKVENEDIGHLKHIHLRLLLDNTSNQQVQEYVARLKQRIDVLDITYQEVDAKLGVVDGELGIAGKKNDDSVKISNHEYQNQLIEEYLVGVDCDVTMITQIKELNRIANESLNIRGEGACGVGTTWRLISLEFSNLFSFGEGNHIDFTAYNGMVGIIAPNHYGKSSILDIILFMLYDKFPRKGSVKDIVNNRKNGFHAKLVFSIEGVQYIIEKQGVVSGTGRTTVKAKFYKYDQVRNIKEILDEESVIKTKNAVLAFVGDYDDMIQTNISLQHQNCIFIDAENTARKKELERILQIDFIDSLAKSANVAVSERKAVMKHILAKSPNEVLLVIEKNITVNEGKLTSTQKRISMLHSDITKTRDELTRLKGLVISGVEEKYRELIGCKTLGDVGDVGDDDGDFVNYSIMLDSNYKRACEELDLKRRNLVRKLSSSFIDYDSYLAAEYESNKDIVRLDIDSVRGEIKMMNEKLEVAYSDRKPVKGGNGVSMLVLEEKRAALVKIHGFIEATKVKITEMQIKIAELKGAGDDSELTPLPSSFITYIKGKIGGVGGVGGNDIGDKVESLWKELEGCLKPNKRKDPIMGIVKSLVEYSGFTKLESLIHDYNEAVALTTSRNDGNNLESGEHMSVEELEGELKHLEEQRNSLEKWISDAVEYLEVVKVNSDVESRIKSIKRERETLEEKVNSGLTRIRVMDADYMTIGNIRKLDAERVKVESSYNAEIEKLKKNKDVLAELESSCGKNVVTRKLIDVESEKLGRLEGELKTLVKEEKVIEVALGGHKVKLDEVKAEIAEVVKIEKEMEIWGYYLDALKAMPYTLIAKVVPLMEKKINGFLSNVANFVIKMVVESGRIDLYIDRPVYNGKLVLLNNASGFERFISSLAIRLALMEISQLPKPNFIAIDEGWTSFDFNNLHNVGVIFDYLKARFEMVINISHLQSIREHCGHQLNLVKDKEGFSCVV